MAARVSFIANTVQTVQLYVLDCCNCGVIFAVDNAYDQRRRQDHKSFVCPNGHSQSYSGPTKAEKDAQAARERADRMYTRWQAEQDQRRAAEREAAAASEIRLRWRVGNGVCPCCQRTFPGLAAHVAAKHPEFLTDDFDRLSHRMVEMLASLRAVTETLDAAVVDVDEIDGDWRTVRALERRKLVTILGYGKVALTEHGWPVAEQASRAVRS